LPETTTDVNEIGQDAALGRKQTSRSGVIGSVFSRSS